jgi:hypothetical protein
MTGPIPSGLSAQLMTAEETTYGTGVTPDRAYEFRQESLKESIERIESTALRAGTRLQRSDRWKIGKRSVAGDVTMELANQGFGRWWKHALGKVVTTQPASVPSPTVYLHTFTPGDLPESLTIQVGRPDVGAVVRPFTYTGCTLPAWTLECTVGEFATFGATILGRTGTTATALATAAYPVGLDVVPFVSGTLTVDGEPVDVKSFTMQGVNALTEERYFLGSPFRKRPLEAGMRLITGTFEPEFEGLDAYAAFIAGAEAELELYFVGSIIEDALPYFTRVTANIRYDDGTPTVGGPQVLLNPIPYKVIDNGTLSLQVEYQTSDATP